MAYLLFKGRIKETPDCTGDWINTITVCLRNGTHITLDRDDSEMVIHRPKGETYAKEFCNYESKWVGIYDVDLIDADASFVDESAYIQDDDLLEYDGLEVADVDVEAENEEYELTIDKIEILSSEYKNIEKHLLERPLDSCP